jgi:lipooligosaccharide transport system permease protein
MWPRTGALRVWRRNLESWRPFWKSFVVASLGSPLFYLGAIGYGLGRFVPEMEGVSYAVYLVPGLLGAAVVNGATVETTFGSYTRMAEQHTWTAILATPCSVADVVAGDVLLGATKSAAATALVLVVAGAAGLVASPWALCAVPLAFAGGCCFGALGVLVTAKARSYAFFDYWFTFGLSGMFFFGGVFFPLETLPPWAQVIGWVLPLTHVVALCRALVAGDLPPLLAVHLAWLATITVGAFALAVRFVRQRLIV